jgi:16S rRNA G1207 methylase RsmC
MNTDEVISAIKRFESNDADFEATQKTLEALTGKVVDRDHLENYWRSESVEEFAEVLATPPLDNWQETDDVRAAELIREALLEPGGAIFLRNGEALEKRFGKSEGFLIDLVFHEDISDPDQILAKMKEDTIIRL